MMPEAMKDMSRENQEHFIENGAFRMDWYMDALGKRCRNNARQRI